MHRGFVGLRCSLAPVSQPGCPISSASLRWVPTPRLGTVPRAMPALISLLMDGRLLPPGPRGHSRHLEPCSAPICQG